MTDRELMQQVLDALEGVKDMAWDSDTVAGRKLIETLRARLEEPEPEPVAWRTFDGEGGYDYRDYELNEDYGYWWEERHPNHKNWVDPLYTAPPQREWQGLTDEEIMKITGVTSADSDWNVVIVHKWVRAIEAKLKEKNT